MDILKMLKAIADENRLKIFSLLIRNEEICACKLIDFLDCNQSTLSHHMKVLVDSGLVNTRKDWKWIYYSLNNEAIKKLTNFLGGDQ